MANQSIVDWLRQYLNQGYDLASLKKTLLQNGYTEKDIDAAARVIYEPSEVKHVIHLSKTTVALIGAVIFTVMLVGGGLFYFLAPKAPSQLLDVRAELIESRVKAGEQLNFNLELTSLGAAKRYDVDVRYDIEKDGSTIIFKEETVGLETSKSYRTFIEIPDNAEPGAYALKITARYGGKTARAASSFNVYEENIEPTCYDSLKNQGEEDIDCGGPCTACPSCDDSVQNQDETGVDCGGVCPPCMTECDDDNICTEDRIISGKCAFTPVIPCCGNKKCEQGEEGSCLADCPPDDFAAMTVWEQLDAIKELAKTDDRKAESYCNGYEEQLHKDKCFDNTGRASSKAVYCEKIEDERTREECYIAAAEGSEDKEICRKITKETRRDRCYMNFATAGLDYAVCSEVADYYLKQLCNSMKAMAESAPEE